MKLKNILLVVKDIEISKKFYQEIFGLSVIRDFGSNVILTEGLVLQEQEPWEQGIHDTVSFGGKCMELYFEESDMDTFVGKLEKNLEVQYITREVEQETNLRVVRIYDPDMHVIEIKEAINRGI